ncbi:MAG: biotin/lipoyl-binding protein [Rhodobacteraceae bacterium]|nr:biotin/lipoyl-binding protein [Paracoccaceae bacterium]
MQFDTVLIANRGEIAIRIIRTAKALGLKTVAVCSEPEASAPHVNCADAAVLIGAGPATESYLNGDNIIRVAQECGAQAIHPGYGFLSENADFARAVAGAGLVFVGPHPDAILKMGNKAEAKRLMTASNLPCIPGYDAGQSEKSLANAAKVIGYPVLIKATSGGGGRGMRLVNDGSEFSAALQSARQEAAKAFGSDQVMIEKALSGIRHVEVQIVADQQGNVIHLGERDCSIQRRYQKLIEESPSPAVTPDLRKKLGAAAITAARAVNYQGAGTVEFLLDDRGDWYFLEMNTRLQVEHPVTECVTGLDLVALQFSVANGDPLPVRQQDVCLSGHAIEARLCAEDPASNFLPATGNISLWQPAQTPGLRVDAGIVTGGEVLPFYDSMLAKVIAYADDRETARARLIEGLTETVLLGVSNNKAFLIDLLQSTEFTEGTATTDLMETSYPQGFDPPEVSPLQISIAAVLKAALAQQMSQRRSGYSDGSLLGWSSAAPLPVPMPLVSDSHGFDASVTIQGAEFLVAVDGEERAITIVSLEDTGADLTVDSAQIKVRFALSADGCLDVSFGQFSSTFHPPSIVSNDQQIGDNRVVAPMPGQVVDILVSEGQSVQRGDTIAILEAMKLQHRILANVDGTVASVTVAKGDQLRSGDAVIQLEESKNMTKNPRG